MKINLGCGATHFTGFINVDCYSPAQLRAACQRLPLKAESVSELWAVHLLEHLPRLEALPVLTEWLRVLKPGGTLVLELPDLTKIAQWILKPVTQARLTTFALYGDPNDTRPGMQHHWGWSSRKGV